MVRAVKRKKITWYRDFVKGYTTISKEQAEVVLLGDSLVANLARYPAVWDHFSKLKAVNCGIGGDSAQHVLWRVEKMFLPATVSVGVIHCGVNDIHGSASSDFCSLRIAQSVIVCGEKLLQRHPWISVIIMGILPAEETSWGRMSRINQINVALKQLCLNSGFLYIEPGNCWRDSQCDINRNLFWRDGLHLNKRGNQALAKSYIHAIKSITYSPPRTTFSLSTTTTPYKDQDECTYISQHIDNMSKIHKQKDKTEETHTATHNKLARKIKKIRKKSYSTITNTTHTPPKKTKNQDKSLPNPTTHAPNIPKKKKRNNQSKLGSNFYFKFFMYMFFLFNASGYVDNVDNSVSHFCNLFVNAFVSFSSTLCELLISVWTSSVLENFLLLFDFSLVLYSVNKNRKDKFSFIFLFLICSIWVLDLLTQCCAIPQDHPPKLRPLSCILHTKDEKSILEYIYFFFKMKTFLFLFLFSKHKSSYFSIILLKSENVERRNPDPVTWSNVKNPLFCNFLRVAIYKMFLGEN